MQRISIYCLALPLVAFACLPALLAYNCDCIGIGKSTVCNLACCLPTAKPQVNLLPVVESGNKVVGVVTRHDILRGIYASKSPFL